MNKITSVEKRVCSVCGSEGKQSHKNLTDKLFSTPGQWSFSRCSNNECNLIWLNPMPVEKDIHIAYRNYYTHKEDVSNSSPAKRNFYKNVQAQYLAWKYGYTECKETLLRYLLYFDPDRLEQTKYEVMYLENIKGKLLDVGCGSGEFINYMNRSSWETIGIDFDEKAVSAARSKGLNVKLGNLNEQKFPNNNFDAITIAHVIEHIYDPVVLLKECFRILKPGGKLIIATPNNESLGHKYFKENWRGLEPPRHIHIFSSKSLIRTINKSGFTKFKCFTTSRISRFIYRASKDIQGTNKDRKKVTSATKIKARLFSVPEWILVKLRGEYGEEVILIAEK